MGKSCSKANFNRARTCSQRRDVGFRATCDKFEHFSPSFWWTRRGVGLENSPRHAWSQRQRSRLDHLHEQTGLQQMHVLDVRLLLLRRLPAAPVPLAFVSVACAPAWSWCDERAGERRAHAMDRAGGIPSGTPRAPCLESPRNTCAPPASSFRETSPSSAYFHIF